MSFLSYNMLIHTPIMYVNWIILIKEITLEFIQVSERRDGHDSNVALGFSDWFDTFIDILGFFNPFNWIQNAQKSRD